MGEVPILGQVKEEDQSQLSVALNEIARLQRENTGVQEMLAQVIIASGGRVEVTRKQMEETQGDKTIGIDMGDDCWIFTVHDGVPEESNESV